MKVPWDIELVRLKITKHFSCNYMRYWNWDFHDLRDALRNAYHLEKCGKNKFEIYVNKNGYNPSLTVVPILNQKSI